MDYLSALFFEDSEDDGIACDDDSPADGSSNEQVEADQCGHDVESRRRQGRGRQPAADGNDSKFEVGRAPAGYVTADCSILGWDDVDGSAQTLHSLIQDKTLNPRKLKDGFKRNEAAWMQQVDQVDPSTGLAPIHHIALHVTTYTTTLLLNLLTYGNANIDAEAEDGKTALMLAVGTNNIALIKAFVALGANVNIAANGVTALELARAASGRLEESVESIDSNDPRGFTLSVSPRHVGEKPTFNGASNRKTPVEDDLCRLLVSVGAKSHSNVPHCSPRTRSESDNSANVGAASPQKDCDKMAQVYKQFEDSVQTKRRDYRQSHTPARASHVLKALQEMEDYRRENGSRILCLDGGGVRGLVQIEMLRQIEQITGKKIIDLFDWIVGTSTGGVIALALVYGKMTVTKLQRFYLRLKRDVFSQSGVFQKGNSKQLEWYLERLLKGRMDRVTHPRVLVSAVSQSESGIKLRFFNNCFEDDFSKEEVWKVARYSSAAPLYFTSKDGYLDGGLLSDNPAEDALTAIQHFYRKREMQLPISLVVSLGSGVNPTTQRGYVDITTDVWKFPTQVFPFLKLLGDAVMNQRADANCQSRCVEQDITYIRLNPELEEEVDCGETDNEKLLRMLWTTRQYLHSSCDDSSDGKGIKKMDILTKALLRST